MRIGVIGAGIGGLAVAAGLQRDGHEVTVYEQRAVPGAIGAGLTLFANAFSALDAIGLGDRVRAISDDGISRMRTGQRDPSGRWLTTLPDRAVAALRTVDRRELHDALASSLDPGTLQAGVAASPRGDGAPVVDVDGEEQEHDLVVAADGLRSGSRRRLGLPGDLRYSGYTAWRGVTALPVHIGDEAGETWGRGRRFGVVPLRHGRVYWFATLTAPEGADLGDEHAAVRARFASWHDPVLACIDATPPGDVLRHDVHDLAAPLPAFVTDRVVLLGDAAHAMTPDLGQGAGQALEDAATLIRLLRGAGAGGLPAALARYDRLRRKRTSRIGRRSRLMGRIGQLSDPVAAGLRDAGLRATPGWILAGAVRGVQRWSPPTDPSAEGAPSTDPGPSGGRAH